jgi:Ribosomal protein L36
MKVRPSVKKICKDCKIVRRKRIVYGTSSGRADRVVFPGH